MTKGDIKGTKGPRTMRDSEKRMSNDRRLIEYLLPIQANCLRRRRRHGKQQALSQGQDQEQS
ncbi:MAG TPA: hypothetical protein ENN18_07695 [Proteobacteria bacterium]|nr:hypothetical protein [Pseudomonadota bacterium]